MHGRDEEPAKVKAPALMPPHVKLFMLGERKLLTVLGCLLLCAATLVGGAWWYARDARESAAKSQPVVIAAARGVAVKVSTPRPAVAGARIAGAPNQTVLLRRAGAADRLYLLGPNSYVVVVGNEGRILHSEEIAGMSEYLH